MIVDGRGVAMPKPSELLQGTLDLLILRTIAREPLHGWGIARRIQAVSGEALSVGQGSLYPALHRLERRGLIRAAWGDSENNRRAKFYTLTRSGRRRLLAETENWERLAEAVNRVLRPV
jgi:transcriptional regulator